MPSARPPWWMYVVAACLALAWLLNAWNDFAGPEPAGIGPGSLFRLYSTPLQVTSVVHGYPLEKAGVRAGDVISEVDGQPVHRMADWFAVRANFEISKRIQLNVRRGEQTLQLRLVLERSRYHSLGPGDYISEGSTLLAQLIMLALALLILFRRPHDLGARLAVWLLCAIAVGSPAPGYGIAAQLRHLPVPSGLIWFFGEALFSSGGAAWLCFFASFPRRLLTRPWHWMAAVMPGLVFAAPRTVAAMYMLYFPDKVAGLLPGWLLGTGAITAFAGDIAGLGILIFNYPRLRDLNERRKVRVLLVGTSVGLPAAALAVLSSNPFVSISASIVFLVFPLSFAYAILRHQLFDIGVIVRQGLQYAVARGLLKSLVPALIGIFFLQMFMHADQPLIYIIDPKYGRGWLYALLAGLAFWAHKQRQSWMEALDRRFFRERYDAQRLLREVVEEVHKAGGFERVAPRVVAQIEEALHPEFAALMVREPREPAYRALAASPAGQAPPPLAAESKLIALVRVLGKPLEMPHTESGWLQQQLPHEETDFLRRARIDLLVPIATAADRKEALLALGVKRSEEPYTREDQDLLVAIAANLVLLLERPVETATRVSEAFEECPKCGTCYDTGAGRCAQEGLSLVPIRLPRHLVGRYRLERRRGRGGMGAVYEATDTALERRVAVKVIRDDFVGSADAAERFRREARASASFAHPNVVTVYDFGVAAETRAFLVMELLEGSTLREELGQKKRLAASRTLEILRGVCAAVDAAHRRQLIHRDLKPENIFLARNESAEVAKVLDFGIAKFLPAATQATADTGSTVLVGTLFYMSPEQLRADPAQPAWDVWALAVVAYEMLTGARPFAGSNSGELHSAILSGRVTPVSTHLSEAPASWQDFFARALALDASRRPSSATKFFSELQQALS